MIHWIREYRPMEFRRWLLRSLHILPPDLLIMNRYRPRCGAVLGIILALQTAAPLAQESGEEKQFQNYVEVLPGTSIRFKLIAIRGGTLPASEPDEGSDSILPQTSDEDLSVNPFWLGQTEVTWNEYEEFYFGGVRPDLTADVKGRVDAVSRPTPPYGAPDRGWGTGKRPAMSMTFYAANQYCEWLSALTGKSYRLPTEKEWEYACRADSDVASTSAPAPNQYSWNQSNSHGRTNEVGQKLANPWGLFDMLGNVAEFGQKGDGPSDRGETRDASRPDPSILGSSFRDGVESLGCTVPAYVDETACLRTDPNAPKSKWWYSDCFNIGLRVARSAE